jgi:hypothetical protein
VPSSLGLDIARSGHHVIGTLIFATSIALTVLLSRPSRLQETAESLPIPQTRHLEGVA